MENATAITATASDGTGPGTLSAPPSDPPDASVAPPRRRQSPRLMALAAELAPLEEQRSPSTPRRSSRLDAVTRTPLTIEQALEQEAIDRSITRVIRTRGVSVRVRPKTNRGSPHDTDDGRRNREAAHRDGSDLDGDEVDDVGGAGVGAEDGDGGGSGSGEDAGDGGDGGEDIEGGDGGLGDDDDDSDADDDGDVEMASDASGDTAVSSATSGRSRVSSVSRVGTVQVSPHPVVVPSPEPTHRNWTDWLAYVKIYAQATRQVLVIKGVLNVKNKNTKLANNKTPLPPLSKQVVCPYSRNYICTHGWPNAPRGTGKRPKRFVRGIKCPMHFRVQWEKKHGTKDDWHLVVVDGCMWHNHRLDKAAFATYPAERLPKVSKENIERAQEMDDWGVARSKIVDTMLDRGVNIYDKDVENLLGAHRTRGALNDDDEATRKILEDFAKSNPDSVVTVDETDAGETGVLSVTSRHMREMFDRFGELLLVDCTHKTNRNNYQLCTFMVMDEYGFGQVVQQSLLERNADWHMERAIDHLIKANDASWRLVSVIVVDKDLNEIRVLQSRFPEVRILICLFHVMKYFSTAAHKVEYGKLSLDDYLTLEALLKRIIYSESADLYMGNKFALETFCQKANFLGFFSYFERNWDSCTEMWVMYQRASLPHFQNHTNNRLENYFGKFKKGVKPTSTMADCVTELINGARRSARKREFVNRVGRAWNSNYDEEMNSVLCVTTHFVAERILPQYAAALDRTDYKFRYPNGPMGQCVQVSGTSQTYDVDLTDFSCSCDFAKSMRLPCRHAMAFRKFKGGTSIIPLQRIDVRWQHATRNVTPLKGFVVQRPPRVPKTTTNSAPTAAPTSGSTSAPSSTSRARYGEAMRIMAPICSELAEIEDEVEFKKYCEFLLVQWRTIRCRGMAAVNVMDKTARPTQDGSTADGLGGDDDENVAMDLSQANSLFSVEMGIPPVIDASSIRIAQPSELFVGEPTKPGRNVDGFGRNVDGSDQDVGGFGRNVDGLGRNPDDVDERTSDSGDMDVADGDAVGSDTECKTEEMDPATFKSKLKLKFNRKAPKHGHPPVDAKKQAAAARAGHIQYNQAQVAARARGVDSLEGLFESLIEQAPSVEEALAALNCVEQRHQDAKAKRPKLESKVNPVLTTSDFFLLPKALVKACMRQLRGEPDNAIRVYTPTGHSPPPSASPSEGTGPVQVFNINQVGQFSAAQIKKMDKVITLLEACREGKQYCIWLAETARPSVPITQTNQFDSLVEQVKATFPYAPIPGLPNSHMAMVYKIKYREWFCAGLIRAFAARLQATYDFVRFAGVFEPDPTLKKNSKSKPRALVCGEALLHECVLKHLEDVKIVCAIVNFGNSHWTSIIVDADAQEVSIYDSFGPSTRFEKLAWDLAHKMKFGVKSINSPRQVDGHSCGILSCYKMWQRVDPSVSRVMEMHALPRRQFEFLNFVVTGTVIT